MLGRKGLMSAHYMVLCAHQSLYISGDQRQISLYNLNAFSVRESHENKGKQSLNTNSVGFELEIISVSAISNVNG